MLVEIENIKKEIGSNLSLSPCCEDIYKDLTIDTREVAGMLKRDHKEIMRMIDGYSPPEGSKKRKIIGIIPTLTKGNVTPSDYFIKSYYIDGSGKKNDCYLCTKMGCEMLGNKLQGEKGILFTAKYVKKFNAMEHHLRANLNNRIDELEQTIDKFEKLTEEAKQQYKPSHKMKLDYSKLIRLLTNNDEEYEMVKQWVFANLGFTKWEDSCVNDQKSIIESINNAARLLVIKKTEQLKLF